MSMVKRRSDDAFFKPPREFPKRGPGGMPIGPRAKKRAAENRDLHKLNLPRRCEIRIEGVCVNNVMLTWAHSKKSRFLVTKRDWQEAARCCLPCHDHIEKLPHKVMHAYIMAALSKRDADRTNQK